MRFNERVGEKVANDKKVGGAASLSTDSLNF